jgi:hypothetical protein
MGIHPTVIAVPTAGLRETVVSQVIRKIIILSGRTLKMYL